MKLLHSKHLSKWLPLILSLGMGVVMYPTLFLWQATPMMAHGGELIDPVVSIYTFIPGFNAFQYEVFTHGNLLWTNLRGLGWPIGGGDIQVAPFFPLTWLWIWLPSFYFWNAFVTSRMLLMTVGSFLIATEMFKFRTLGSLFFALNFVFCTYHVRWMNHPWLNGACAGLWYLYFLHRLSLTGHSKPPEIKTLLGLLLAVYSMITCGFPEGSAAFGFMALLILFPVLIGKREVGIISLRRYFMIALVIHILGAALASPQIFLVLDTIKAASSDYRKLIGQAQLHEYGFLKEILTPIGFELPAQLFKHHFNLIPFFFFGIGFLQSFLPLRKPSILSVSAICCTGFYLIKAVPIFPTFNSFIGSLPILETMGFDRYFFNLVLFSFAYFSALGFELFFIKSHKFTGISLLTIVIFLIYAYLSAPQFQAWRCIGIFTSALLLCFIYLRINDLKIEHWIKPIIPLIIFGLGVHETRVVNRSNFLRIDSSLKQFFRPSIQTHNILREVRRHNLDIANIRLEDVGGRFVGFGLSTPDLMDQAIMSSRLEKLRRVLFHTAAPNGSTGILGSKVNYGWSLISNQFFLRLSIDPKTPVDLGCGDCVSYGMIENSNSSTDELYFNQSALPRAYQSTHCFPAQDTDDAIKALGNTKEFKLGDVHLENLKKSENESCLQIQKTTGTSPTKVAILNDFGDRLHLGKIRGPQVLVVNDSFFQGWQAYDEIGKIDINIKPANINFRGLLLPEDRDYKINLYYRPEWYYPSIFLIISSILFCGIWTLKIRSTVQQSSLGNTLSPKH